MTLITRWEGPCGKRPTVLHQRFVDLFIQLCVGARWALFSRFSFFIFWERELRKTSRCIPEQDFTVASYHLNVIPPEQDKDLCIWTWDDRLAHNSIMEDCFMVRLWVWTFTDTHHKVTSDPRKTPFVLWNSIGTAFLSPVHLHLCI